MTDRTSAQSSWCRRFVRFCFYCFYWVWYDLTMTLTHIYHNNHNHHHHHHHHHQGNWTIIVVSPIVLAFSDLSPLSPTFVFDLGFVWFDLICHSVGLWFGFGNTKITFMRFYGVAKKNEVFAKQHLIFYSLQKVFYSWLNFPSQHSRTLQTDQ